jgi:2C-methyl-D-erythritol 2,4-cyclodiphosphate synthase
MKPHRDAIIESLSNLLSLEPTRINLKAKTLEGMQVTDLIMASATCLITIDD